MSIRGRADTDQFVALAGLRGVAALVVVQWHGKIFLGGDILPAGYLAVDFFFLLSGWVLAHAYDKRLDSGMTAGQFMRLRLIRLYPVYLLALGLTFLGWAVTGQFPWLPLVAGLVFLPGAFGPQLDWLVRAAWSLTAELVVNLPFASLHRRLTTPVLAATSLLALAGLAWIGARHGSLDVGHNAETWPGLICRVFLSFPLGVLMYRHRAILTSWAPNWSTLPAALALVLSLAAPAGPLGAVLRDTVIVSIAFPAILLFASAARPSPVIGTAATTVGNASYAIYLLHVVVFVATNDVLQLAGAADLDAQPLKFTLPLIAGIVVLGWLTDRYYDRPVRGWLFDHRRRAKQPEAVPPMPAAP